MHIIRHQLEGGYQPIGGGKGTLSKLLTYINEKYGDMCWISTFEDVVLYRIIRDHVTTHLEAGKVVVDITKVKDLLTRFTHPHALLTLKFVGENIDFASDGLVSYRYDGRDSYCTIDLRKSNEIKYISINKNIKIQEPMRNLVK